MARHARLNTGDKKMTNLEINLAIAKIEYPNHIITTIDDDEAYVYLNPLEMVGYNYCNNWEDIEPIVEREAINFSYYEDASHPLGGIWLAFGHMNDDYHEVTGVTRTKAASLCYLKMKGVSDD